MNTVCTNTARLFAGSSVGGRRLLCTHLSVQEPILSSNLFSSSFANSTTRERLPWSPGHYGTVTRTLSASLSKRKQVMLSQSRAQIRRVSSTHQQVRPDMPDPKKLAYIALGSNIGDRLANIERACRLLSEHPRIDLRRTSSLYETVPMYVEDQGHFINGVAEVLLVI